MKNYNHIIWNRTRDLATCTTVPQLTALPRAPNRVHNTDIKYNKTVLICPYMLCVGRNSSVGKATTYELDGQIQVGDEIFRTSPERSWGSPSLPYYGYRVLLDG